MKKERWGQKRWGPIDWFQALPPKLGPSPFNQESYGRNSGKLETDTHVQGLSTLDLKRISEPSLQSFFPDLTESLLWFQTKWRLTQNWNWERKVKPCFPYQNLTHHSKSSSNSTSCRWASWTTPSSQVVSSTLSHGQLPPRWLKVLKWSLIASHQLFLPNSTARAEYISCFFYNHRSAFHILNPELGLENTFQWVDSFIVAALSCYDARFQNKLNHSLSCFPFYCSPWFCISL